MNNFMVIEMLTSQRCPTIGASAQECSLFRPILPFLNTMRLNDLSNHLWKTVMSINCFITILTNSNLWMAMFMQPKWSHSTARGMYLQTWQKYFSLQFCKKIKNALDKNTCRVMLCLLLHKHRLINTQHRILHDGNTEEN